MIPRLDRHARPMPVTLRCLAILVVLLPAATRLGADPLRPWRNADGSRTIEAEFVRLEAGRITLRLKDGRTTTFPLGLLAAEDREFAENESRKLRTDLAALMGLPGQALDRARFGMTRDAFDEALAGSSHTQRENDAKAEFFGQSAAIAESIVRIDGRLFRVIPVFEDDRLAELHLSGTPVDAAPDSHIRARLGEMRAAVVLAFGQPAETFDFPDPATLPRDASGVTDTWTLADGRTLDLAIARGDGGGGGEKERTLACVLRLRRSR